MISRGSARADHLAVGLVGCGAIAAYFHLRHLRRMRGVTLKAVADPSADVRARMQRITHLDVHERADDLLARADIDAVVICAPSQFHASLTAAAAAMRKHVYVEKPIATTKQDALSAAAAVTAAHVVAAVGFNRRKHPLFEQARTVIESGRLGAIRAIHSSFCEPPGPAGMPVWRERRSTGGGVLLDLASHHIDALRWLTGHDVTEVSASMVSERTEHDTAWLDMRLGDGVEAHGFYSFRAGLSEFLEFIGEHGTLRVDRHRPSIDLRLRRRSRYGVSSRWVTPTLAGSAWRLYRAVRPGRDPSYGRALRAFVDAVHGQSSGLASMTDGLRCLETVLAAERSASRSGRAVAC